MFEAARKRVKLASLLLRIFAKGEVNPLPTSTSFGFLSDEQYDQLRVDFTNWTYMCVTRIADSVSATPLRLWKANGDDKSKWEEIHSHPLLDLLDAPNPDMDRTFLLQYISMHDDLFGKSFSWMVGAKDALTIPDMIYPLDPSRVTIKGGKQIPKLIQSFAYRTDGEDQLIDPSQVMYMRRPDPKNIVEGYGPAQGVRGAIGEDSNARKWLAKMFKHNAVPGILLKSDIQDSETQRLLRESFDDMHSGVDRAYRTGVLPQGVDIAHQGTSGRDMEFAELRRMTRDETLAGFGMPAVILGLGLGETINRASAETLEYIYTKYTMLPKLRRIESGLNRNLTHRFEPNLYLEFDNPVPANMELEVKKAEMSLGRQAWASINDVRAMFGLPKIVGGDDVRSSQLMVPVGAAPEGAKAVQTYFRRAISQSERAEEKTQKILEGIASTLIKEAKTQSISRKQFVKDTESWQPQWEAFVKRVVPHEDDMQKKMALYAAGMGDRARSNLSKIAKDIDPTSLLNDREEVAAIIKMVGPVYQAILEEEGKSAADLIGEAFDAADKTLQDALEKSISLMAEKYTQETMDLLQQKLSEGLAEDENLDQLADRVATIEEFSATTRAMRVAKTEAFRTANFATRGAWKQSGVVSTVKWYTAEDEQVCEFCGPQNGEIVGIDENFYDKGDVVEGDEKEDGTRNTLQLNYADVENPPLHPNCRCYIRPEEIGVSE